LLADNFQPGELEALSEILNEIRDAEFRARVGDIIWECKRDHKAAHVAVSSYVISAKRLKTEDLWPTFVDRLERAVQLSARLGFGDTLHQQTLAVVKEIIQEFADNRKSGFLCERLMSLLIDHEDGDPVHYSALSENIAADREQSADWHQAHRYWNIAGQWHQKAKNLSEWKRVRIRAAEAYVNLAESGLSEPNQGPLFAAHWIACALEGLRQASASPERISEIHRRLLELQRLGTESMKSHSLDLEQVPGFMEGRLEAQRAAREHVSNKPLHLAVMRLAFIANPVCAKDLRETVIQHAQEFIFSHLFPTSTMSPEGLTTDSAPPAVSSSEGAQEERIRKEMYQQAIQVHWPVTVDFRISPARRQIMDEYAVRLSDLRFLVSPHPFVAAGREGIYARGLLAGMNADWLVATHLLIPQLEYSIRCVFQQNGIITSTLDSMGIQKERPFGWLLTHEAVPQIFGEDMAFDLRALLVEKFGANLRNDFAHGLVSEGAFYVPASQYLWWLMLRILCIPLLKPD
jgi:hypothetical protein